MLKKPDLHYLRYMAMLPEHRSKGYGGQMLELVLAARGQVPLALDIEPPDERAANFEQRVRRQRFYLKHGMVDSGYRRRSQKSRWNFSPLILLFRPSLLQVTCSSLSEDKTETAL